MACLLGACGTYSLIEGGRVQVSDRFSVAPSIPWSRVDADGVVLWTVEGALLHALRFFDGVEDGDALLRALGGDQELPRFRAGMAATEVQELLVDTLAATGAGGVEAQRLRPAAFGAWRGFRFEFAFLNTDGLEIDGLAAGAVDGERLYLIVYTGARRHYFSAYRDEVERILDSVQTAT
jgi:hypothetical protein